jgi:hypothetical protein
MAGYSGKYTASGSFAVCVKASREFSSQKTKRVAGMVLLLRGKALKSGRAGHPSNGLMLRRPPAERTDAYKKHSAVIFPNCHFRSTFLLSA